MTTFTISIWRSKGKLYASVHDDEAVPQHRGTLIDCLEWLMIRGRKV